MICARASINADTGAPLFYISFAEAEAEYLSLIHISGYGCLFLLTAAALTVKSKKPSDAVQLLWVLSIATIVWGAMTGTWFGLEGAMDVPLLRSLVVSTFANYPEYFNVTTTQQQNSVMKFCFILGTVQLSLACVKMCIRDSLCHHRRHGLPRGRQL